MQGRFRVALRVLSVYCLVFTVECLLSSDEGFGLQGRRRRQRSRNIKAWSSVGVQGSGLWEHPSVFEGEGLRVEGGGWRVEGGGWRVEGGGCEVDGGGWRVEGGAFRVQHSG